MRGSNFIEVSKIFTFKVVFLENFNWQVDSLSSVFYSIISNFDYFRPKGFFFCPVSSVFLLHMG